MVRPADEPRVTAELMVLKEALETFAAQVAMSGFAAELTGVLPVCESRPAAATPEESQSPLQL